MQGNTFTAMTTIKEDLDTFKEVFATKEDLRSVERNLIDRIHNSERNSLKETSRAKLQVIIVIVVTAIIQPIISIIYKKMGL